MKLCPLCLTPIDSPSLYELTTCYECGWVGHYGELQDWPLKPKKPTELKREDGWL